MKKVIFSFFVMIALVVNFSFAEETATTKKVVSIVYDDSGSMADNNNFCYSNYALQILTAAMEKNDELNIVKMSRYMQNNPVDLSNATQRQRYIDGIRQYDHVGGTPFESVTTAKNWLLNKSKTYEEAAEYWLVVITDGVFSGMPNLSDYINEVNDSFNNLNFEFVVLTIGDHINPELRNLKDAAKACANTTLVEASDRESIYSSLMQIAKMINGGATDKIVTLQKKNDKTIILKTDYPLKKMLVLMQNENNSITSVRQNGSTFQRENFEVSHDTENLKGSLTHVVPNKDTYLEAGEYEIIFKNPVELNKNILFLCEAFVNCEITVVNSADKPLTSAQLNFLLKNDMVRVKCEIFNSADGSKPEEIYEDLNVQLVNNKNRYQMKYDKNTKAFYADLTLIDVKNNIYAVVEADELFRVKSNVILIDTAMGQANLERYKNELQEIIVPYSSSKEYEALTQFRFSFVDDGTFTVAEPFKLELIDLPKGVKVSYQGKEYGNGSKIPMIREIGKEYVLDLLVNKDYTDTDETLITLKIESEDSNSTIYWTTTGFDEEYVKLKPKAYPIKVLNKNQDLEIDVQNEKLILNVVRTHDESDNSPIIGYIDAEDIKKIKKHSSFTNGFSYKVVKNEKNDTLEVEIKPNIFALFGKETAEISLEVILNNEMESGAYNDKVKVTNVSAWLILRPYIFLLLLIIIVMGYVTKKKFNKKSQITITEGTDSVSYALKPELKTLLIPYLSHKTKIGMIEFKAGSNSNIVFSGKNLNILKIDGEDFEAYLQNNSVNLEKIVMKKDLSVVTIEAFDVIQKYEYLTKEVELTDYSGDDFSDDFSDEYSDEQF